MKKAILILLATIYSTTGFAGLTIFSDRPPEKIDPIVEEFKGLTKIEVKVKNLTASEIEEQLASDGNKASADLVIVKDMIYGNKLAGANLLQPLASEFAANNVDPSMVGKFWTAITYRARTLVYDKAFDVSEIDSYADLADGAYEGTLCLRTSQSTYNQALAASMIESYGEEEAYDILSGWLDNQADFSNIYSSDSQIIKDIALQNGTCRLGITNSYYLGALLAQNPELPVGIKFLKLKDGGVSTNGIVAGITAASQNGADARSFIEFLLSEGPQRSLSQANQDFPANKNVTFPKSLTAWSGFQVSTLGWENYVEKVPVAQDIFTELDYL